MRAAITTLIIVLILGGGVGLYFWLHTPANDGTGTATSTTSTAIYPSDIAGDFYKWYLGGLMNDQHFSDSAEFHASAGKWLTQDFIDNWQNVIDNTEQNPVLLAQDYQTSWFYNIHTAMVSQTPTSAVVSVTLGIPSEKHDLIANMVREDGSWRILSITNAP